MLKVEWADAGPLPVPHPEELARLAEKVLRAELPKAARKKAGIVNLVFCENAYVRDLNRRFRKLDKVTDVLSFHYEEEDVFGEIYIATLKAKSQAPRWKNTFYDELRRLVVHGALHLAGFDHMNAKDRAVMRSREDHYLAP
ncbi:MAG TPA: rRNA maturation RNase YbeY [Fibrobacteria bacterium]|nr:rRNA maturation RNase YbeY [Fibrobacteria bacterium]